MPGKLSLLLLQEAQNQSDLLSRHPLRWNVKHQIFETETNPRSLPKWLGIHLLRIITSLAVPMLIFRSISELKADSRNALFQIITYGFTGFGGIVGSASGSWIFSSLDEINAWNQLFKLEKNVATWYKTTIGTLPRDKAEKWMRLGMLYKLLFGQFRAPSFVVVGIVLLQVDPLGFAFRYFSTFVEVKYLILFHACSQPIRFLLFWIFLVESYRDLLWTFLLAFAGLLPHGSIQTTLQKTTKRRNLQQGQLDQLISFHQQERVILQMCLVSQPKAAMWASVISIFGISAFIWGSVRLLPIFPTELYVIWPFATFWSLVIMHLIVPLVSELPEISTEFIRELKILNSKSQCSTTRKIRRKVIKSMPLITLKSCAGGVGFSWKRRTKCTYCATLLSNAINMLMLLRINSVGGEIVFRLAL